MSTKTDSTKNMSQTNQTSLQRLGFGATGAWGKSWFSANKAKKLAEAALEHGIRHFDTAGFYAGGVAEKRLGSALASAKVPGVEVSSKIGTRYTGTGKAVKDFSVAAIRNDVDASLKRLQRKQIDIVYLHGPTPAQIDGTRKVFAMLKQEGKLARVGVCGEGETLRHAVKMGAADVIMGRYNAFDQSHADIFAMAKDKDIGTVAIAPLGQALYRGGFLMPTTAADAWYLARALGKNRSDLKHARLVAANALGNFQNRTPAGAMLGFVLANPNIDIVMTNTTRLAHLEENIRTAEGPALDDRSVGQLAKLERQPI